MTPSDTSGRAGREAHEDDPTGVRALLRDLPDPGPMPQDLVARIEARLEVERAHRDQERSGGLTARSDAVADLAAERSHRRPGRTVAVLGAAAAGLLVATVAIGELGGTGISGGSVLDSAAQVPVRSGPGEAADEDEGVGAGGAEEGAGLLGTRSEDVLVLADLGTVVAGDYHDRVLEQVGDARTDAPATGGDLSQTAAQRCWESLGPAQPWPVLRAAPARMEGQPVVVLLGTEGDAGEAAVLPWSCTSGVEVGPLHATSWASSP